MATPESTPAMSAGDVVYESTIVMDEPLLKGSSRPETGR